MSSPPDIVISFAHLDNLPMSNGHAGWVDRFHALLQQFVSHRLGRTVEIWRDPKLQGNDVFFDEIADVWANAKLFIAIVSPRFVESEWCIREVRSFVEAARKSGGVQTGDMSRMVKVLTMPSAQGDLPPELRDTTGYEFFRPDEGRLEWNVEPHERTLNLLMARLAQDVTQCLKAMTGGKATDTMAAPPPIEAVDLEPADVSVSPPKEMFVCYAREDEEFAMRLARRLESRGVVVFIDQLSIPPSADWDRAIDAALERCNMLVVVLSPDSVASDPVRSEWHLALDAGKPVLPILRKTCSIPRQLRLRQHLDMTGGQLDDDTILTRLVNAIRSL